MCAFFRGPDDLSARVTAALANYVKGNPMPPSVDGPTVVVSGVLTEETKQNYYERLRQCYTGVELDALTPAPATDYLRIGLTSVFVEPTAREDARPELPRDWLRGPGPQELPDGVGPFDFTQLRALYEAKPRALLFDL